MMVVTGLLPVIGVPLPFISSGGSALLASMTALGLLISFARREPGAQEAIGARLSSVRRSISILPAPREDSAAPAAPAPRSSAPQRTRKGTPKGAAKAKGTAKPAPKSNAARSSSSRSRRRRGRGSAPSSRRS